MFSNLMSKIFGHATPQAAATPAASNAPAPAGAPATPTAAASSPVDVTAILDGLAAKNSEKLDWKKSIVDLLNSSAWTAALAPVKNWLPS